MKKNKNKTKTKQKKTTILLSIIALSISVFFTYCFYLSSNSFNTGWVTRTYLKTDIGNFPLTISYPSTWFFDELDPHFNLYNYNPDDPSIVEAGYRPEDINCRIYSLGIEEMVPEITNPVIISKKSLFSYKIIKGSNFNNRFTIYQIDSRWKSSTDSKWRLPLESKHKFPIYVLCFTFSKPEAKIVDQIVKTIRY